jgi:ketosteroid isomerase-like protein
MKQLRQDLSCTRAWRRVIAALAVVVASAPAAAIDFGTLRLYTPPGQAAYAEITLSDSTPLDAGDIRARIATPDAYSVANMRYVAALQGIVLTPQAGPNGQVVLRMDRLPAPGDVPEIDLLLLVGDRMTLALGEYRVNLRSSTREFAAAAPGSRLGGPAAPTAVAKAPPMSATTSPVASNPAVAVDTPVTARPAAPAATGEVALSEVEGALQAWVQAWSRRDVDAYIAAYTPDYAGRGRASTREAWMAQRRTRILARQKISVEISKPKFAVRDDSVVATFNQNYRGDDLSERSRKRVVLVKLDNRWLIKEEEEL